VRVHLFAASHRQAGERFGVSAASVSRCRARERGEARALPWAETADPDRSSAQLVEETPDIAIEELRQALTDQGVTIGYGTIRRFFARHAITRKKRRRTRPNRTAPTS
jgi:transposase